MNNLQDTINTYLIFCQFQKRLDRKTLKAYRIDLKQYKEYTTNDFDAAISTVSYTHLDVYKRQTGSIISFFKYALHFSFSKNRSKTIIFPGINNICTTVFFR